MTESAPQSKENFLVTLKNRVTEIKNEAVALWKNMDSKDAVNTYLLGGGLAMLGVVTTIAGRKVDLWPIEGLGDIYTFMGAGAMFGGYIKLMELDIKAKFNKGKEK